jgi:hypothetical protein
MGVYWMYFVITCVFVLNKLGYFAGRGVFTLLLPMRVCYLIRAILILIPCGRFLRYVLVFIAITLMMLHFG